MTPADFRSRSKIDWCPGCGNFGIINALKRALSELGIGPDGAVVVVLARADRVAHMNRDPIWVQGVGWATETSYLETHSWEEAEYLKIAAGMAYRQAGIRTPRTQVDFVEVNDEYSYKELQHLEALGLCAPGEAGALVDLGLTEVTGDLPVNVSGGSLGGGHLFELDGGQKILETVLQLRKEAGENQLEDPKVGLAASWRGVPTTTGAVAILST